MIDWWKEKTNMMNSKVCYRINNNVHKMDMSPECFPYNAGKWNKQEPHDLQKYTVLHQWKHPTPNNRKKKRTTGNFSCLKK
jgi:hypothetical protein